MNTKQQLEGMVWDAAHKSAVVYMGDVCEECGGELDDNNEYCANETCDGIRFDPLDIGYQVDSRGELTGVVFTIATGGPHVEVVCRSGFYTLARGWWGSDKAENSGNERADDIVNYYDDLKPFTTFNNR